MPKCEQGSVLMDFLLSYCALRCLRHAAKAVFCIRHLSLFLIYPSGSPLSLSLSLSPSLSLPFSIPPSLCSKSSPSPVPSLLLLPLPLPLPLLSDLSYPPSPFALPVLPPPCPSPSPILFSCLSLSALLDTIIDAPQGCICFIVMPFAA